MQGLDMEVEVEMLEDWMVVVEGRRLMGCSFKRVEELKLMDGKFNPIIIQEDSNKMIAANPIGSSWE